MTEWGNPIKVGGERPNWLKNEKFQFTNDPLGLGPIWHGIEYPGQKANKGGNWRRVHAIRLTSDHPYYRAMKYGYTYRAPENFAPADWDGSAVLLMSGVICPAEEITDWGAIGISFQIIGYRKSLLQSSGMKIMTKPPFVAPLYTPDEFAFSYFNRLAKAFEIWVNAPIDGEVISINVADHECTPVDAAEQKAEELYTVWRAGTESIPTWGAMFAESREGWRVVARYVLEQSK